MQARSPLKIATVVGARPQFIKAAAISRALAKHGALHPGRPLTEVMIHTGQHYDAGMSDVFFAELGLPTPAYHLEVGSGPHGAQTGEMLKRLESSLLEAQPDIVLVYGDTNSTLAGALVAAKLQMPLAHVEAGLRSFNRRMPEEINRIVADRLSSWLFGSSEESRRNLAREGIETGVHIVGDVMYDVLLWHRGRATTNRTMTESLGLESRGYALATVHRAENTDTPDRLRAIIAAFEALPAHGLRVVWPLHPRTRRVLQEMSLTPRGIDMRPPASYEEMLALAAGARVILTDSGGVQKEAYWLGIPCVTLRDETEWVETVTAGWNRLVGCRTAAIIEAALQAKKPSDRGALYGDGDAAGRIVSVLADAR